MLFYGGLCLFKGLCLMFLQNVPRGTFIQGDRSILDSRVVLILEKILQGAKIIGELIRSNTVGRITQQLFLEISTPFSTRISSQQK